MKNELVESLRQIIECYDLINDPENAFAREITMWRTRFLNNFSLSEFSREVFLCSPSECMMKYSPEEYLEKDCRDGISVKELI